MRKIVDGGFPDLALGFLRYFSNVEDVDFLMMSGFFDFESWNLHRFT